MKQAKILNDAEFKRLTAVVNSLRYPTRNNTIVALSFYAGLRACEIAALKVGDLYDADGNVKDTVYLSAAQTKGQLTQRFTLIQVKRQLIKFAKCIQEDFLMQRVL